MMSRESRVPPQQVSGARLMTRRLNRREVENGLSTPLT